MKPKNIDLANKCGSCCWFEPIEGTCSGYCLRNKYGENVVCDPEHPYWQVARSRAKCVDYNTNADHIRSMTDEELAERGARHTVAFVDNGQSGYYASAWETSDGSIFWTEQSAIEHELQWLKQPYKEEV